MVFSRARASSFRFAIRSLCLGEPIGFFAINGRVFGPSGWRKFDFVNWNDPIAPRVSIDRYSCGLLASGKIQNNFDCRRVRRGVHGKDGGWTVNVAGHTTLDATLPSYLPERHINPRICWSRLFAVLTGRILLFPMLRESLPGPVSDSPRSDRTVCGRYSETRIVQARSNVSLHSISLYVHGRGVLWPGVQCPVGIPRDCRRVFLLVQSRVN